MPKDGLIAALKHVFVCMGDRDAKVRDGATASLNGFMIHVGYPTMCKMAGDNKKIREELDKAKELLPKIEVKTEVIDVSAAMGESKSGPPKKAPRNEPEPEEKMEETVIKKPKKTTKTASKMKTVKGKPVVEEELGEIIIGKLEIHLMWLSIHNEYLGSEKLKQQREKDDTKLKSLKWTFDVGTMPRDELVDQLKVQCQTSFGPKFLEFFYKSDGPSQSKAIGLLANEELEKISTVLDLILRWITIRFSEKNTTVFSKILIFLTNLFAKMNEDDYRYLVLGMKYKLTST